MLKFFGWSLVKINRKLPTSFVNEKPSLDELKYIIASSGILHMGAHRGKEAEVYQWFNKKVLWIEANPEIFEDLNNHIKYYFQQTAINALLGDKYKKKDFFLIFNLIRLDYFMNFIFFIPFITIYNSRFIICKFIKRCKFLNCFIASMSIFNIQLVS